MLANKKYSFKPFQRFEYLDPFSQADPLGTCTGFQARLPSPSIFQTLFDPG